MGWAEQGLKFLNPGFAAAPGSPARPDLRVEYATPCARAPPQEPRQGQPRQADTRPAPGPVHSPPYNSRLGGAVADERAGSGGVVADERAGFGEGDAEADERAGPRGRRNGTAEPGSARPVSNRLRTLDCLQQGEKRSMLRRVKILKS